jgi:hypothetical protein
MLSLIGAALGLLMFIWGFLKWFKIGDGANKQKYAGFAFGTPTSAVIGLSLAAGLVALLGAVDRRPGRGVPSAIPTALAGSSLLVALGILLGKGSISPDVGAKVGVEIGLILGLITAIVQTAVLGMGLASRHDDAANTGAPYPGDNSGYDTTAYGTPGQTPGYAAGAPGSAPQAAGPGYGPGTPSYGAGVPGSAPQPGASGYPPAP